MGNRLIYADSYDQALAQLSTGAQQLVTSATAPARAPAAGAQPSATGDTRLAQVRDHLRRYRELASQGKWGEAGRELEAIEGLVKQ